MLFSCSFLCCYMPVMTSGKYCEFFTFLGILVYGCVCLLGIKLWKGQRIWLWVSNFALFSYIFSWAKSYYLLRSSKASHFYHKNVFEVLKRKLGSDNKSLSNLSVLWLVYQRSKIWNVNRFFLSNRYGSDYRNSVQKIYSQYLHSWHYYL